MKNIVQKTLLSLFILLMVNTTIKAQENTVVNDYQNRLSLDLKYKASKKIQFYFTPEIRLNPSFAVDRFLFEGRVRYKPIKYVYFTGIYRFIGNPRKTKETQYLNRIGFSATAIKEFNRFEPSFRVMFSNYTDDEITNDKFMRYKFALSYDIDNSKLTPYAAAEAFQQLGVKVTLYKMRYTAGVKYKINKRSKISVFYKLDYYETEYVNKHIFGIEYNYKFN